MYWAPLKTLDAHTIIARAETFHPSDAPANPVEGVLTRLLSMGHVIRTRCRLPTAQSDPNRRTSPLGAGAIDCAWRRAVQGRGRGFSFFVVLEGAVEIVEQSRCTPREVTVHEPGEFTGDVDTLSGRAALVTARATAPGNVSTWCCHCCCLVLVAICFSLCVH